MISPLKRKGCGPQGLGSGVKMLASPLQRTTDVDYSQRLNRQARRLGKLDAKRAEGKRQGSDKRRENLAGKLNESVEGQDIHTRRQANQAYSEGNSPAKKREDDPCWKGYEMVGMKNKGGKEVPNCVPLKMVEPSPVKKRYCKK